MNGGAPTSGPIVRPITDRERLAVGIEFDWSNLASGLAGAAVAVVLVSVVVGLPLYLLLQMVGVAEAWSWVQLLLWAAVALFTVPGIVAVPFGYVKARWALHRALDSGVVEDRVLHVIDAVEVEFDAAGVTGYYLRDHAGAVFLLIGGYLAPLRRAKVFPSSILRVVRLPGVASIVGLLPMGDALTPAHLAGSHALRPAGDDGAQVDVDFAALLALATR
jgi:hypothetical protein